MKTVIILVGVSGSGKSTLAKSLVENWNGESAICSADDYFIKDRSYIFDAQKLNHAHEHCHKKFMDSIVAKTSLIVVDNTNTKPSERDWYIEFAKRFEYYVVSLIVENIHGGQSIHNVPQQTLDRQKNNIKANIRL